MVILINYAFEYKNSSTVKLIQLVKSILIGIKLKIFNNKGKITMKGSINMSFFRILHLSDIHIGKTYKSSEDIAYKVISDIDQNGLCSLRSVVVTGDIFDGQVKDSDRLINEAITFFEILLEEINLNQANSKISKEDFIFVPGNHDLIRVDNEEEKWAKYKKFLSKFYGTIPKYYNVKNYSVFRPYDKEKIVFLGFNSCQIEKKKIFNKKYLSILEENISDNKLLANGIIKKDLLKILEKEEADEYKDFGNISLSQIADMRRKVKGLDEYNVVALFHHHFYLFPEVAREFGDSSLVRNYTDLVRFLKYMNVKTVLHGHKHFDLERPFITDDYYNTTESIIDVFAGGSVGTNRKDRHTFSVIDFYEKKDDIKLLQNKFIYNEEELEPIARKQIPPQNLANRIVKLLEMLKTINPQAYIDYTKSIDKIFKIYNTCNEITNWVSEAITGFNEVYKYLDDDFRNILFLLYAINYRTLSYKAIVGKENSYFESSSVILKKLFIDQLKTNIFCLSVDDYHSLFGIKKLNDLANKCDKLLNKCTNKTTQLYLAFSMVGVFFADLYLVLTEYADDFKESIKYKINIKIEENKFHENVPAPRIVLQSDADRRSAYVQLLCNEATAHKMAVLFIKEFDLMINKFEDYFKLIGLKLYYLIPKIDKDNMKNTLDNYNFEAYIPTLLPLLTGDNIYKCKVVFSRELIQNSIDAIAVREEKGKCDFPKKIFIEIGKDKNKKRYFKIKDNGTGMDRYKIERYFTSIGRSFYSGDEYEDLNISYRPISNFGIGFLSSFMVCQEIGVRTKYYLENSEGLKLHIPNYDGCFFIERDENTEVGTELKLYLNNSISSDEIVDYIKKVMLDIKYSINIKIINEKEEKEINIHAHQIRKNNTESKLRFFIPFNEKGEVLNIEYEKEVINGNFIDKYEYGLLIQSIKQKQNYSNQKILNAGILVEQTNLSYLFGKEFDKIYNRFNEYFYNDIIINFPANWVQIDVSREKITGFTQLIKKSNSKNSKNLIGEKIAECLYNQILCFLEYSKKTDIRLPIIYLQKVIQYAISFCGQNRVDIRKKIDKLKYILNIKFTDKSVIYEIKHRENIKQRKVISYENDEAKLICNKLKNNLKINFNPRNKHIQDNKRNKQEDLRYLYRLFESTIIEENFIYTEKKIYKLLNEIGLKLRVKSSNINYLFTLLLLMISDDDFIKKETASIISFIEIFIMQTLNISNVEKGINSISVNYDDLVMFFNNKLNNDKK